MRALPVVHDRLHQPTEPNLMNRFLISLLRDERDLPFLYLVLRISFTLIPLGLLLFMPLPTLYWWLLALGYLILNFMFKSPYGLMLHCISHRRLFKKEYEWLMIWIVWVVGVFIGHTPHTYFSHHIGMHHPENNMPEDESSTMPYQRDSFKDFLKYLLNFLVVGLYELIQYLNRKNRKLLAQRAMKGEFSFFIFCVIMLIINFKAACVVFVLPFIFLRMIMMVGNWTQHSLIDHDEPGNPYKNCITCINVKYNHKCWNDGYHSSHHARQALHWTEHPSAFLGSVDVYAANKAIVFDRLDFGQVFVALMRKDYEKLADHVVNVGNTFGSRDEVIATLKARTRKFTEDELLQFMGK